ncbi:MAG: hypothetical protein LQ342_005020 [Letrouitia transgressa]|nr:MAG: hypothetical protein LQ342_005020 [Letrouitia transgressa]
MAPEVTNPEDDDYDSAADSDFGGSLSPSSGDESSGDEGQKSKSRKRVIEDSGDEGIVKEGKSKRRKKAKGGAKEKNEGLEESAIGMRVRERKLGRAAEEEKKPLATSEGATVDVDALWARLNSAPTKPASSDQTNGSAEQEKDQTEKSKPLTNAGSAPTSSTKNGTADNSPEQRPPVATSSEDMITIKRTYVFAGETITEEKQVPKSSAEARLYLQSQSAEISPQTPPGAKPLRRPKKRSSMFEPNPEGIVKGLTPPSANKGPKLNTVEKSKLDWATHVDKEGLKDELDDAEKAKGGYLGRMEFLGRSEAKREEEMKNARRR